MLSLEFADPIFSGNGVYSRTIARSLLQSGYEVMVVSGVPSEAESSSSCNSGAGVPGVETLPVKCDIWKRLDRYSSWEQFGNDTAQHKDAVTQFEPDVVIGVDWTSVQAFKNLGLEKTTPFVYMNFRWQHTACI